MEGRSGSQHSSRVQALRWSWALVIASGLLFGYYALRTYGEPKHRQYQLDFGRAQWIEPAEAMAPTAYFRKEVYLSGPPEQAWLQIAASDNFGLVVNGHTLGTLESVKTFETGIYDLKGALKEGTNVIAVSVARTSYPGPAQLLICGRITELNGSVTSILSDETWRVSNRTGIVGGTLNWMSAQVEDELWPAARRSALNDKRVALRWVDTNPRLLQLPSIGYWIMADNASQEAIFSTVIEGETAQQETWIQVASSGDLDLTVNGHVVIAASSTSIGEKELPHLPAASSTPSRPDSVGQRAYTTSRPPKNGAPQVEPEALIAYDISYWIKNGPNVIVAAVRSNHVPATLFASGFLVEGNGELLRFATNAKWRIGDQPGLAQVESASRAVEVGKDGMAPWGYLSQELAKPPEHSGFATLLRSSAIVVISLCSIIGIWLIISALVSAMRGEPLARSMSRDALFHGPIVIAFLLMLLPNYDPRFPDQWSFRPTFVVSALATLFLIRLIHLFADSWTFVGTQTAFTPGKTRTLWEELKVRSRQLISRALHLPGFLEMPFQELLPYLLLVLLMSLGFGLRYHNLGYMSFDHDEMGLVSKSKGIFALGFPYTSFAGEIRWITTYEAVPYPLAAFGFLFGYSEWSMRLPACFMGTLCIAVIGLMGRRMFDWRTGFLAALVYACMPLNVRWAQNAFYLTQCQLMAVLTFWLFYEAVRSRPLQQKFLTAATVTFCLSYLSWEGTGFILPALFLALLAVRWGQWWWLREFHLYRCLFFIGAVVVAQYCSRMLAGAPYLQVGSGLSNLTGPSLFFLAPGYQPMFYVDKLLLAENHVFFTLMIIVGLPFCRGNLAFRYIVVLLATLFILHSNFLAALSPRYCYYFQPLVVIGGVAAAVMVYDRVISLAKEAGDSGFVRFAAHTTGVALLLLLFVQSNESVLKEYTLSNTGDTPQMMTRMNTYRYDYRGAAEFVKSHARPGDVILPGIPHVFNFYNGSPGDYFLDTLFSSKVPYNQLLNEPRFADKFAGLPVIRNIMELKDVVHRSGRTWVIFVPYASFEKLNNPTVVEYLHQNSKAEFESYRAKVFLIQGAQPASPLAQASQVAE